ncbi:MAG: hypothetical protein IT318_18210 [Anaerolineales bacterium]|nr:hypothetical protein [Anaerolineales bacterium]
MNDLLALLTMVLGLLLRFGLPVGVMVVSVLLLRRLDARWQADGQRRALPPALAGPRCWEARGCAENGAGCVVRQHPDLPCWQQFRDRDGNLRPGCLVCQFFRSAPGVVRPPVSAKS